MLTLTYEKKIPLLTILAKELHSMDEKGCFDNCNNGKGVCD
jgi:hypothetical protein